MKIKTKIVFQMMLKDHPLRNQMKKEENIIIMTKIIIKFLQQ